MGPRGSRGASPGRAQWLIGSRRLVPVVVAAVVVSGLAAWVVIRNDEPTSGEAVEVVHVHGLGVNPADQDLYVATHHGVFRIAEEGKAARVGDRVQDTMGFTVAGPGRFLASGHPDVRDMRAGASPLLGLIESTDAGETWRSLSLDGEADFHALAAAHGLVYGYDSTGARFMVRSGQGDWDVRSSLPLGDFAVDPSDPGHVVGAGADGLLESVDGGRNWMLIEGPVLAAVSWESRGTLFGAAPDGTVHRSADGGTTWAAAGSLPGQPEALLALPEVLYAAAAGTDRRTGIYRSDDRGTTWKLFYRDAA